MTWSDEPRTAPPAGWYADPGGTGGLRYWDGATWTGHLTEPRAAAPAPGPSGVAPLAPAPPAATPPAPPHGSTPVWVWVAVVGILLVLGVAAMAAIAVPAFRVGRDAAWDAEAQDVVRRSEAAAVDLAGGAGFTAVTADALDAAVPSGTTDHSGGPSTGPSTVSVYALPDRVTLATRSRSGTCWVVEVTSGSRRTGRLAGEARPCVAATATDLVDTGF